MMKADVLRQKFLDFFKGKKHKIVESDSLVPKDDPTVLFTPAGMNQFKKQFLGHLTGFSRAASSQRCLRTDDLDKVGKTPCHHTFFEMLGNFSFGDYFKEEAVSWAWEFLTEELEIPKEKLWVSVYKDDEEAYKIWKDKIKVPINKIIKLGDKENFWPSEAKTRGPNGPCGPCSEIFYDQGDVVPGRLDKHNCGPTCNCGRFVEVWNLVFTQFNRKEGGALEPLPKKNIDTGMGLERLTAAMQKKSNNFETELFMPLKEEIVVSGSVDHKKHFNSVNAVADHIRAITFAIYDGVLPSNEGRGYVIRKLIRKSTLHLRSFGLEKPFLYKLVPVLSEIMKIPYPDLDSRKENISEIILREESKFIETLDSSESIFKEKFKGFSPNGDIKKAGLIAFQLYDTYGIPFELTKNWLNKQNIGVSYDMFDEASQEQKARSRLSSAMKGDVFDFKDLHLTATKTNFSGYAKYEAKAKVLKIVKTSAAGGSTYGGSTPVKKINKGEEAQIILDKTVFYPEGGGQVSDTGELIKGKNIFRVTETQKFDKVIVHKGTVKEGSFKNGDELKAVVDIERRLSIARNHTATHLLQAALRRVLGEHVQQQGSLVAEDRLRFDFTHFKDISQEELNRVEEVVNNYIISNVALKTKTLALSEAKKQGALAFFGEKYENRVRMVLIGDFSKELCAGTHLDSTGSIGIFKIVQEGSVASGVRRIEAVTGKFAYKKIKEEEDVLSQIANALSAPEDRLIQEIEKKLTRLKELEKESTERKSDALKASLDKIIEKGEDIKGIKFFTPVVSDMDSARRTVDLIKDKVRNNAIIVSSTGSSLDNKILWAIGVTEDLFAKNIDASVLNKEIGLELGGSGGGRKDFAQGGGNKPQNYKIAVQKLKDTLNRLI